jgi:hypothetical protein
MSTARCRTPLHRQLYLPPILPLASGRPYRHYRRTGLRLVGCAADSTLPPRAYTRPSTLRCADPITHVGSPPPLCASPHPILSGDAVSLRSTASRRGWCKGTLDLRSNRDLALVPTLAHQQSLGHIASGHPSPLDCLGAPDLTPSVQILIITHASLYHLTDSHP